MSLTALRLHLGDRSWIETERTWQSRWYLHKRPNSTLNKARYSWIFWYFKLTVQPTKKNFRACNKFENHYNIPQYVWSFAQKIYCYALYLGRNTIERTWQNGKTTNKKSRGSFRSSSLQQCQNGGWLSWTKILGRKAASLNILLLDQDEFLTSCYVVKDDPSFHCDDALEESSEVVQSEKYWNVS